MARIRTIKPEFWKHEDLSALPEPTHMLAAALLNYSDDEGYFNANPGLIKAECSPLREPSVSIQESLNRLENIGYLRFGCGSDGKRYGRIVTFADHQVVNRPSPSKIKDLVADWESSDPFHGGISDGSPPEGNREQGTGKGTGKVAVRAHGYPKEFHEQVVAAYHELATSLPTVRDWSERRRRKLDARVRERVKAGKRADEVEYWRGVFEKVNASDFLCGRKSDWRCPGLEWILESENFLKVIEGAYDNTQGRPNGAGHAR
jgi:hypothetical protein